MVSVVIIGAGECGVAAAFAARKLGNEVSITLIDSDPALPYERPPLSKGKHEDLTSIRSENDYLEARVDLWRGKTVVAVEAEDKIIRFADGTTIGYDKLLFATGARARKLPQFEGCLTLRTAQNAFQLMQKIGKGARIGIIGGGFIGLEIAATARTADAEVSVFEVDSRLLRRAVPEAISSVIEQRHQQEGVDIHLGARIASANATSIALEHGEHIKFDAVIAGVGSVPNTELAQAANIDVKDGILVDAAFRTSRVDVFAAGDCCAFPWRDQRLRLESWRAAQDQGAHVASSMLGEINDYDKVPWFWSQQYNLTLQVAGLFDPAFHVHHRETSEGSTIVFQLGEQEKLCAAAGIGPGNAIAKEIRILELLIERNIAPEISVLIDPSTRLKSLLRAT